ncbi:MAG: pilus assembly protein TadD [Caulobacter sp.]|jgi:Flp pilus assembly protein TadD|nr:pilus assembly protein TadD [Caulobacter sp.]
MCPKRALAATVLIPAVLLVAGPAAAWPFGGKKEAPAPAAAAPAAAAPPLVPAKVAPPAPQKATPAQRVEARRYEPLAAAAFWGREVDIDPRDVEASIALSQSLRALGRFQDAADTIQAALIVDPNNLNGLLEQARAYIGMNQGFYAIEPARKASALAQRDWRPVGLLAVAYEQAQRDDEALAAHRQAVALAPDEPGPLSNYAMFQAARGDLAGAETLLRRAVASPRVTPKVRQNLALVVGLQGRLPEAERLARQDLPPEMVASNLAWLKEALAKATPASGGRSYQSVTGGL